MRSAIFILFIRPLFERIWTLLNGAFRRATAGRLANRRNLKENRDEDRPLGFLFLRQESGFSGIREVMDVLIDLAQVVNKDNGFYP